MPCSRIYCLILADKSERAMASDNVLMVFTKNPVKGKIKTRLAKDIGETMALKAYMYLLKHTREITQDIEFSDCRIFYDEFIPSKDKWKDEVYDKFLQGEGDLATKMVNAFKNAFDDGYQKAIIISPDCPELTTLKIKQAFTLLNNHDYVLGPLQDGGYYLLGMKTFSPEVIEGMEFGHDQVFNQTIERMEKQNAKIKVLPETYDVDYAEDIPSKLRKEMGLEITVDANPEELKGVKPEDEDLPDNEVDEDGEKTTIDEEED